MDYGLWNHHSSTSCRSTYNTIKDWGALPTCSPLSLQIACTFYCTVLNCTALHCTALCCVVFCYIVWYCIQLSLRQVIAPKRISRHSPHSKVVLWQSHALKSKNSPSNLTRHQLQRVFQIQINSRIRVRNQASLFYVTVSWFHFHHRYRYQYPFDPLDTLHSFVCWLWYWTEPHPLFLPLSLNQGDGFRS